VTTVRPRDDVRVRVDGLRVLLSLEAFKKKTRRTPKDKIALAKRRLRDWERRG